MGQARLRKYNSLTTGFILGMVLPLVVLLGIALVRYPSVPFFKLLTHLWEMKLLVKIVSLCGFVNLLVFTFFYRNRMDMAARGVIMATFFYAVIVLISRLV